MSDPLIVLQKEVFGHTRPDLIADAASLDNVVFSTKWGCQEWRAEVDKINEIAAGRDISIHCSINVAEYISRHCPNLTPGLIYRPERMRFSVWSGLIGTDCLLNRESIMLPFGVIASRKVQLEDLFGPHLFMRPDSARKLFTGYCFSSDRLQAELAIMERSYGLQPEDLIIIDRGRRLHAVEYRFWISQGRIVTSAPYALADGGVPDPADVDPAQAEDVRHCLEKILAASPMLETIDEMLVMDMATEIMGGAPRLVEINAWSTSGFYPGADLLAILTAPQNMEGF